MNKQRRALLGLCLTGALFLCTGFTHTSIFSDVVVTNPCYEAVEYLANAGIVSGCGNGEYCPDRKITPGEYVTILARLLYPNTAIPGVEGAPWYEGYFSYLTQQKVLTMPELYFFQEGKLTWAVVWRTLLPHFGIYYYPAEYCYDTSSLSWYAGGDYHDATVAAIKAGLFPVDGDPTGVPTRGELAIVISNVMQGKFVPSEGTELMSSLLDPEKPLTSGMFNRRNGVYAATKILPEGVFTTFSEKGWKVRLYDVYADNPEYATSTIGGLCCYDVKHVYIESTSVSTVIHEFGHFMMYDSKKKAIADSVFSEEKDAATEILRGYAQTNAQEYFACAVECYYLDPKGRGVFQQTLPYTYALVESVLLNYL